MSDMGDAFREHREYMRDRKAKEGIDCPGCQKVQTKRIPSRLLPGWTCKVCGYRRPTTRKEGSIMDDQITVGVKVMKSHDYCHFEVQLSESGKFTDTQSALGRADLLGIEAQRLVDAQIARYKKYKAHLDGLNPFDSYDVRAVMRDVNALPEDSRTPEMKALLKAADDFNHWAEREFSYGEEIPNMTSLDIDLIMKQLEKLKDCPRPDADGAL